MEKEAILKAAAENEVKYVQMIFMDILGIAKNVTIPVTKLERAIDEGVLFDGSSVQGYTTIDESDMRMHPDLDTFQILPFEPAGIRTARIICNIHDSAGKRFDGDPRYILEKVVAKAKEMGYQYNAGPEYEFFLFQLDDEGHATTRVNDRGGYFDLMPLDQADGLRKEIMNYLEETNMDAEASHHEVAPGQHEIDLHYSDGMTSADRVFLMKYAIKTMARRHGLHATFMPKPIAGINGTGMHVHQSLFTGDGNNAFDDPNGQYGLSRTAFHFIAGNLKHARETCAILNSWVNSYKRLLPGYEAPVYISWANSNRSALVRVPAGRGKSARMEVRNPDPAGNPYLQFAVMLAAGLKGIEDKLEAPEPVEMDIYGLTPAEREKLGIAALPENLGHALSLLGESQFMRETLGEHTMEHFIHAKTVEWEEYRSQVTQWELDKFLPIL